LDTLECRKTGRSADFVTQDEAGLAAAQADAQEAVQE